jgi:hypothetical protein
MAERSQDRTWITAGCCYRLLLSFAAIVCCYRLRAESWFRGGCWVGGWMLGGEPPQGPLGCIQGWHGGQPVGAGKAKQSTVPCFAGAGETASCRLSCPDLGIIPKTQDEAVHTLRLALPTNQAIRIPVDLVLYKATRVLTWTPIAAPASLAGLLPRGPPPPRVPKPS